MTARARKFLAAFAQVGTVTDAAKLSDSSRDAHYKRAMRDPTYAEAFTHALEDYRDAIRAEVIRRAIDGVKRDVHYKGVVVGQVTEYSDRLLEALAKAHCPEFRDRHEVEHSVAPPTTIRVVEYVHADKSREETNEN